MRQTLVYAALGEEVIPKPLHASLRASMERFLIPESAKDS